MRLLVAIALLFSSAILLSAQDGATLYQRNCASCHDGGMDRAPARDSLRACRRSECWRLWKVVP